MNVKKSFLKQSYIDNWELYQDTLENKSAAPSWDVFIITASNQEQAEAYRLQIDYRKKQGLLPAQTKFLVIPDPDGKRIGSGGATLNALYQAYSELDGDFSSNRVIIIHSGGDSKRIPQYSAFGKLFSKVPRELPDGRYSTLFDEFVICLSGLPSRMKEGVLIASGDVLLLFNHNQIDLGRQGVVGISIKTPVTTGSRHGVYVSNQDNQVTNFLQKKSVTELENKGAVNEQRQVDIDTGLVWFDAEIATKMMGLITDQGKLNQNKYQLYINEKNRLNLYSDLLIPFTEQVKQEDYLQEDSEGTYSQELVEVRKEIWNTFNDYPLYVQALSPAEFIHFGTTREFRDLINNVDQDYKYLAWSREVVSFNSVDSTENSPALINSYLDDQVELGNSVVIEDSLIESNSKIGSGSVLSNIYIKDLEFDLKDNLVLHQLPVIDNKGKTGYVTRIYGVNDNPKDKLNDQEASFLNRSWSDFMDKMDIKKEQIWPEDDLPRLWDAKLYPVVKDSEESIKIALLLQQPELMTVEEKEKWLKSKRVSLAESYQLADQTTILKQQQEIEDQIRVGQFINGILNGEYIETVSEKLGSNQSRILKRVELIKEAIEKEDDELKRMRLSLALAEVLKKNKNPLNIRNNQIAATMEDDLIIENNFEDTAFKLVNQAISEKCSNNINRKIRYKADKLLVRAAARVNIGGGWSDTPPYSLEAGGTVLNTAISLKGKLPIKVEVERIDEPVIICSSRDLNVKKIYSNKEELMDYQDPSDPLALLKAAFIVAGIVSKEDKRSLTDILTGRGGGISLSTKVDIPKGSGLGTSSILAGAVLKGLNELIGSKITENELFDQVLYLEQLLTTGGGWQDQVGGLTNGIKLITSRPGIPQQLKYEQLNLDEKTRIELDERLVVIFTGQRRLAKRILREIMGKYILNDPEIIQCLFDIQKIAIMMKFELEKGNLDAFAQLMNDHWQLNKKLDPGSTNSYVDHIFEICKPYMAGGKICGAGGGGFIQILLKDAKYKKDLQHDLKEVFQDSDIGIWESEIVDQALTVDIIE